MKNVIGRVAEPVPPRPWFVMSYGCSLAEIRDSQNNLVFDQLNYAVADFIVRAVNAYTKEGV